ncbi:twin-arginine translocase TatA/TatE family subunit [Legionella worsleiensis]|uniref:TatB protein (Twin arginine translocation) n=1 Tax=Legionella worsleiensis TaxID=45076 RepID=A0A0W1AEL3_9GAMM|nr:twin-arginine translocase TatA/TatE family subunit [Legionella worsleiensis]KTD79755.1 TatB protein (twin arginine translocation) [Legionella worsleiensis]STY32266.1 sec-independent protein translocase protein TatB [Legionella worsleiensis]
MSSGELIVTLIVAVSVFGPSKLPMLAKHLGLLLHQLNRLKEYAVEFWQQQLNEVQLQENKRKAELSDQEYQKKQSKSEHSS